MKKLYLLLLTCVVATMFSSCKMSCTCEGSDPRALRVNMDEQLFFNCEEMTDYYHYLGFYDVRCY